MKIKRGFLISWLVVALSLLLAGTVVAHALLVRSIPAANAELLQAPTMIELWFSEALESGFSSARVLNAAGQEVPVGTSAVDAADPNHLTMPLNALTPGIYTVAWKTLSRIDGHEWYGSFPFTVLNPDGSRPSGTATDLGLQTRSELPTPLQSVARWLSLLGGMVFLGAPLFLKVALRSREDTKVRPHLSTLVIQSLGAAVLMILAGSWLQIAQQAGQLDDLAQLPRLIYGTRLGALALARQLFVVSGLLSVVVLTRTPLLRQRDRVIFGVLIAYEIVLLLLIIVAGFQGEVVIAALTLIVSVAVLVFTLRERRRRPSTQPWMMLLALGAIALMTFSLGSHAGAVPGSGWALIGDYAHLVAAAAWIGGLLLLPILIGQLRRSSAVIDRDTIWSMIRRYSYLASLAVFGLIVTGVFNGLIQLPNVLSLFNTNYGRVLLIKLAVIAVLLGAAFSNNRLVHRRAHQAIDLTRFNRQVALEALGGVLLMLVVAVFVQTQPARDAALTTTAAPDLPFNDIAQADDVSMHVQISPNHSGENRFWVHLYHADGTSVGDVQLVRLIFNYRDAKLGQATAELQPQGKDVFALDGAYLTQSGKWDLSIYVRRRGMDDAVGQLSLTVPGPIAATAPIEPWQDPLPALPIEGMLAGLMIALGVMPFLWHRLLRRTRPALFPALVVIGGLFIGVGVVIGAPSVPKIVAQLRAGLVTTNQSGAMQSATIDRVQLTLHVTPAHPGNNEFAIEVADPRAGAQSTPGRVLLDFKMMDMDMGVLKAEATSTDQMHYVTHGDFVSMGGHWRIDVTLHRPGFEDVTHAFDMDILRPTTR